MGKKVGDYILGNTLGSGAYAKVKKAVHATTKKTYAIKIINAAKYKSKNREEWLRREVAVLRKLDHPNIVQLHDVLQQGDKMHLVLEYVNGGELLEVIAKVKRLLEDEARQFFHQLISGVAYMHSLGIVHRDLKPENILVTDRRVLKIADFGLSNIVPTDKSNSFQLMSTIVGSPDYCAPEVVQEKNYDGFKADIYSCGTILYTMVAGARPFEAKDEEATLRKVAAGIFMVPRHVTKHCDVLIHSMMELNPDKRIDLKGVIEHPWMELDGEKKTKLFPSLKPKTIDVTEEDIDQAIQQVQISKASGNAFSLIAGLQSGDVDALVGKSHDAKFLLTVKNMQQAFTRVVGLLKKMKCKVQERKTGDTNTGKLLLYSYITMATGVMTFTTELQARPPSLVAVTLRKERGDAQGFEHFSNVFSSHLCDLFESYDWEMIKGAHTSVELLSPLCNQSTSSLYPQATGFKVSETTTESFTLNTRAPKCEASDLLYEKLFALDTSPVLLKKTTTGQLRILGFITPEPPVLLTFTVEFSDEAESQAAFTLNTGNPKLFIELQAAVQD